MTPAIARPASTAVALGPAAVGAYVLCALAALQPVRPVGAAGVAVLLGVVGHAMVGRRTAPLPRATRAGLAAGAGLLVGGLGAFALAALGLFGPPGVAVLGALLVVAAGVAGRRDAGPRDAGPRDAGPSHAGPRDAGPRHTGPRHGRRSPRRIGVVPLALLALAGAGSAALPAYAFDVGGRDAGFYVMTSEHLRSTGHADVVLDADVRDGMRRFAPGILGRDPRRPLPGFYAGDAGDDGVLRTVVPHGYGYVPAAMAAGATVTGGGGQWVVTLSAAALVLLAAGAAALLAGAAAARVAALAAGALLACDAALLYFARYPMTEVPSGVVLLTAGLAAAAAAQRPDRRLAALAGVALGAAPLVRPDAWPLLVAAPVFAAVLARRDRAQAAPFLAGLAPLTLLALLRATTATGAYTDEAVGQVVGGVAGTTIVGVLAAVGLGGAVLATAVARRLPIADRLARGLRPAGRLGTRRVAAAGVLAGTLLVVVHPPTVGLGIFREYATRPGLLLAAAGLVVLLLASGADARRRALAFLPLLALGGVALALVARDPQVLVPDQYWTARRYLPLPLPLAATLGGVAVAYAWGLRRGTAGAARTGAALAAGLLLVAALGGGLSDARQALTVTEFDGVPEQVDRIDGLLAGHDPLVLAGPSYTSWAVLAPSLALRSGRDVVMLDRREVERRPRAARLDAPGLGGWIARVARRRPVYLVTANVPLFGLTYDPRVLAPRLVGSLPLAIRQIDHAVGAPPTTNATRTDLISVFRLDAPPAG